MERRIQEVLRCKFVEYNRVIISVWKCAFIKRTWAVGLENARAIYVGRTIISWWYKKFSIFLKFFDVLLHSLFDRFSYFRYSTKIIYIKFYQSSYFRVFFKNDTHLWAVIDVNAKLLFVDSLLEHKQCCTGYVYPKISLSN